VLLTVKQASKQSKNLQKEIDAELEPHQLKVEKLFKLENEKDEFYVVIKRK